MDRLHMDRDTLATLLEVSDITTIKYDEIVDLFFQEKLPQKLPEGSFRIDPRNGDRILYHVSRSIRPHDNIPESRPPEEMELECVICRGETTGIVDVADLSEGFTFINKNLFPVLFPHKEGMENRSVFGREEAPMPEGSAYGLHFLQWTSSFHDRDWHNMPVEDCRTVVSRLAALERKLIDEAPEGMIGDERPEGLDDAAGHVLIIKNYGRSVGASISHGHQQVLFSNITPSRALDHFAFQVEHDEPLTTVILRDTPVELLVKDYGVAVLLVPTFMRRPYEMFLVVKDTSKQYLNELSTEEITAVGSGWHDATRIFHHIMPRLDKEVAYNVASFTGPGAGIYFEFLPNTQPMGALERIGMYVCQETPERAADTIKESLKIVTEASEL
jgi:galactose-1-phosphate uridylyltransferase